MSNHEASNEPPWPEIDQPFETEDEDLCPLCMEELDISDLNFRPCPCGYRICRFCWHHIKEDLNSRCPGCRKEYDDSVVEFKPMKPEELKRLQQAKKQREKERKDLELVNRKHLANVRVKQKNQVHVQGLTTKIANQDTLAQLKTSELFAQYGRIQKMFMSRRTGPTNLYTPDPRYQHVNLYINFTRNNEAMACIQGIDGTTLPDGHRLKASLGSTKYCASFLRGLKCMNENCTGAHELAEEVEGSGTAAREEMSTARHAQKESEHRHPSSKSPFATNQIHPTPSASAHPMPSGVALPASASWATKSHSTSQPASPAPAHAPTPNHPIPNGLSTSSKPPLKPHDPLSVKSTHSLPLKPRSRSSERSPLNNLSGHNAAASSSSITNLDSTSLADSSTKPSTLQNQTSHDSQPHQNSQTIAVSGKVVNSGFSSDSAKVSITPLASPKPPSHLLSNNSHPPGLLPPGLTSQPSGSSSSAPPISSLNRPVATLPPGLLPSQTSTHDPTLWRSTFDVNGSLGSKPLEKEKLPTARLSQDLNILSSFSPNFDGARLSIFGNLTDGTIGSSNLLAPSGYSGTFNPFADTDLPPSTRVKESSDLFDVQDSSNRGVEGSLNDRRGSRFGFARSESSRKTSLATSGASSSPLRSIFSGQNAGEKTNSKIDVNASQLIPRQTSLSIARPQDSSLQLANNIPDDSAPDASVLFPGVNLAASYSANALPVALARGMRSPGVGPGSGLQSIDVQGTTFQPLSNVHPREAMSIQSSRANDRMAYVGRQAALSPTSFTHIHTTNHHDHLNHSLHSSRERRLDLNGSGFGLPGQYPSTSEMHTEFQDPAILNIRMANNGANNNGGYNLGMMQSDGNNHSLINEIHGPFSLSTNGFNNHMMNNRTFGYHPNASVGTSTNENSGAQGIQYNFPGVLQSQSSGIGANSIGSNGSGSIGTRLQQSQNQNNQNFYHHHLSGVGQGGILGGGNLQRGW
ncbi:hypothetical protein O181_060154 [Austropuccinia psidii MF-1]|uniref:RING-type domain-containing protein n=1 Tax=Austropuccinia psidii MF-1 TaxID=1389203 RepID=A0A9Q3EFP4_9BASI|nr:hypothetical protein [Austropuccinia psidii MF-1]